ncbi:hypothetical protein JCM10213_004089 [Rhodosporidiobolus nylandii]
MAPRKSTRYWTIAAAEDAQQEQPQTRMGSSTSLNERLLAAAPPAVLSSSTAAQTRPAKKRKHDPSLASSPLTPLGPTSSAGEVEPQPQAVEQPRVSLARLPLDILARVGHFLVPVIERTREDGSATRSAEWIDHGTDLIRFSSASRATWAASRHLVGRSFGIDARELEDNPRTARLLERRLRSIVPDDEYDLLVSAKEGPQRDYRQLSKEWRPLALHEHVPASRVRHLFVAVAGNSEIFAAAGISTTVGAKLAQVLLMLTNLQSIALAWRTEREVVSTSPYDVAVLPAEVLLALTAHPSLRDLFLCGIKLSRYGTDGTYFCSNYPVHLRFQPNLRSITLNACPDASLKVITCASGVKELRVWRDFARQPIVLNDHWWTQETWKTVERLDMTGFSGDVAAEMLQHWQGQLVLLRSLTPPVDIPLRTLRLTEPHQLATLQLDILPTLANLPHLTSLTVCAWNERSFGPQFLDHVYEALPGLEELGIALENESLNWWQGSLTHYASTLRLFSRLRVFTWNYSPYADLDYAETRGHVFPMLQRSLLSPTLAPPKLEQLRWFNEAIHVVRVPRPSSSASASSDCPPEWAWSNDPRFHRPLPRWAVDALRERKRPLGPSSAFATRAWSPPVLSSSSSAVFEEIDEDAEARPAEDWDDSSSSDDEEAARRRRKAAKAARKAKGKAKAKARASAPTGPDKENDDATIAAAKRPRLSIGELLLQAKAQSVKEGKRRAVEPEEDEEQEEGGEMEVADL